MGFMLAQLLVGLGSAAALHLVAHGMYKSSAFLTSGSSLEHRPVTPPSARRGHHLLAAALTACAVVIGSLVSGVRPGQHHGAAVMTLAFAAAATFAVLDGPTGVRRGRRAATAAVVTGTMLTLCTYLWVAHHIEYWLRLPEVAPSAALALAAGFTAVVLGSSQLAHLDTEPTRRLVRALRARSLATSRRPLVDALLAGGR
jgi:NADH:ubiquinone oxidoreductase subunit 5 (subunit L)/multisubunit Na+/H+ antiporter MnhA subunit